jgi:hypothetical protein
MRKIYFSVLAMYAGILAAHSQSTVSKIQDTGIYESRKLTLDEVNFVSAYYHQNGNNSAVTGGIGTEKLSDFANTIDVQFSNVTSNGKKNTLLFEVGVDHYTSASSDKIDPYSISSASRQDTRFYPSLNWTKTNISTGNAIGFTGSYSHEYDYQSFGGGFNFTRLSKNKNRQFDFKAQAFLDTWEVILPVELRPPGYGSGSQSDQDRPVDYKPRNSFSASFSISQIINSRLQALLIAEPSYQHGLLATKYQRDYFTDGTEKVENLPDNRYKLPIGLRLNYFLDDRFIIRTFYRYYTDDWGIRSHTGEIEMPVKVTPFVSVSPFYRYVHQTGTRYFAAFGKHLPSANYYTSDYDLSGMHSQFVGANVRLSPPKGLFGVQQLNSMELRFGHYIRSTGLNSNILTLAVKIK